MNFNLDFRGKPTRIDLVGHIIIAGLGDGGRRAGYGVRWNKGDDCVQITEIKDAICTFST